MRQLVQVDNFQVTFDVESLARSIQSASWDEYLEDPGNHGSSYGMTETEFNVAKNKFTDAVKTLTSAKVEQLFREHAKVTKKGTLDARKNHVILESGMITSYDDNYGSHSYKVPSLVVVSTGGQNCEVVYQEVSHQDSF